MRSGAAPVPSNRSSQQKKQKAASLLQLTACFYVWSERLDSNQRPPAPKAGALPCCATLRDGMFCTQKALLWQGRPVWRPRALPALREKPPPAGQDRGPLSLARQMTTADRAPSIDKDEREHARRTWPFPPRRKRISRRPFPANEAYPFRAHENKAGICPFGLPARAPGTAPLRVCQAITSGRKRKTPLESGGISLWGERWDLNPRPPGPQPGALPTELLPP